MAGNINFRSFSCSFRFFFKPNNDQESSNFRSQSFSQDSFNSSFSSRSSLPSSISAAPPPSTTIHHQCLFTINPNSDQILSLTIAGNQSNQSNPLFIGSANSQIHCHPTVNSGEQFEFISRNCNSAVKDLQFLKDDTLVSAHQDCKIRVWKIKKRDCNDCIEIVATLPTLKDRLMKGLFAKNYVTIRRHRKRMWIHHNDAVSSVAVSVDRSVIYSASWDRSFKVWRSSDYKCLESVSNAHDDAINSIVVSEEGFVYTGSADKKIKVWKFNERDRKHELISSLVHHKSAVNALAYDDNLCTLISGACSGVMIASERNYSSVIDEGHMVVVGALLGHRKAILCVRIVGELVCSGSADKTVRLWRSVGKSYSCLGVLEGHSGPVKCLAMATESSGREYMVYSGSLDGEIKAWKVWVSFAIQNVSKASMTNHVG